VFLIYCKPKEPFSGAVSCLRTSKRFLRERSRGTHRAATTVLGHASPWEVAGSREWCSVIWYIRTKPLSLSSQQNMQPVISFQTIGNIYQITRRYILETITLKELSAAWEITDGATAREPPNILWNPKVHYRIHKSSPPAPSHKPHKSSAHHPILSFNPY
jgi:hypothetical protein